ncbi:uncharacterized protein LOC129777259 [Toxorhynchites rutilus septentrionalis]|uniref:uncharacterized protein LOC129777259 n=1 Tax=Toxorhynchites rutilus septentrionalis TaxID=329112 RepID=UPI00247925D6|nr:uncharacterized protein LOC129777259 [Toxorhynchites rutilus septentrionalis]XP_055639409.1 uncharacterized protein LOC129777259 [Toxorhynchites rutilus septentrionalis]
MAGNDYVSVDERIDAASEVFDVYEVLGKGVDHQGEEFSMDDQLFQPWPEGLALYVYIGFVVGGGILLNLILIKGILQAKYSGALYFVLQIAILDIFTLLVSIWELFYIIHQQWIFETEHCTFYIGFESFTNIAVVYFVIGLNCHSISTYNLAQQISTAIEEDMSGSCHDSENNFDYLAAEENNYEVATENIIQKRSLTIDYRHRKTSISVMWPVLLVWFIAMSESLPLFLFSDVISTDEDVKFCTVLINDRTNHYIFQWLVIFIRIVVPTVTLAVTTGMTIFKFYQGRRFTQPNEVDENVAFILKVAIFLSLTYAVFSLQKLYGSLLFEVLSKPLLRHKYPEFDKRSGLICSFLNYFLSFIRPLLVIVLCKLKHNHVDITFIYKASAKTNDLT